MKRIFISILICIFSVWLLPLTVLVKPSQDKIICDGQRAICLCRHQPSAGSRQPLKMAGFQSGQAEAPKESSGGMPPQFLVQRFSDDALSVLEPPVLSDGQTFYSFRFIPSFEHVPRVV